MKKNAFALPELLVVVVISVFLIGVVAATFLVGRNTWLSSKISIELQQKARFAMDKLTMELKQSQSSHVFIEPCEASFCVGDLIRFQTPQITDDPVAGTYYFEDSDGLLKWGADGILNQDIIYLVPHEDFSEEHQGRLVRLVAKEITCPNGSCEPALGETCSNCPDCAPCSGGPCFVPGTSITMADGTSKPIEHINVDDEVLAFNEETKQTVKDAVKYVFLNTADRYLIVNGALKVTPNHPVYHNGQWVEIGSLKIGDELLNQKGELEPISDIQEVKLDMPITVYDLNVNPYHTYFAEGYLVHNKKLIIKQDNPPYGSLLKRFFSGVVFAQQLGAEDTYNITVIADDITNIEFEGLSLNGDVKDYNPDFVNINIAASQDSMVGRLFQFMLESSVSLRN
ncbi:polymorphic toxin-type HINT domain-containing protein [Candidatus Omnitrophota bacterium]